MKSKGYVSLLEKDKHQSQDYFKKSIVKTEQQKFLEELLMTQDSLGNYKIADVACGGGTLSFHLSKIFSHSEFLLSDLSEDALEIAKSINSSNKLFSFNKSSIYDLQSYEDDMFDYVFCWQTLSWIDNPEKAINELIRICKPGGRIYCSSLFNLDRDVDVFSSVIDHTRQSSKESGAYNYNTYSKHTVSMWLDNNGSVRDFNLHKFETQTEFFYSGKGLGTNTMTLANGSLIQVSAGMLLNWFVLEILKDF